MLTDFQRVMRSPRAAETVPTHCFRTERKDSGTQSDHAVGDQVDSEESQGSRRLLVCRTCDTKISDAGALFAMDGNSAVRCFANPAGQMFEVMTLRYAESLTGVGVPTTDFTWFSGYAWQITCCDGCRAHLGWVYTAVAEGSGPDHFFGLLRAEVVERDAS